MRADFIFLFLYFRTEKVRSESIDGVGSPVRIYIGSFGSSRARGGFPFFFLLLSIL